MTDESSDKKLDVSLLGGEPLGLRPYSRGDGSGIPPIDENKVTPTKQPEKKPKDSKAHATPDSSYQGYLFGRSGQSDAPAWSDSSSGRAAIRLFSRGIMGAAFFAVGGRIAQQQLKGYNRETWQWGSEETKGKPLQAVAKAFDETFGLAVEKSVEGLARFSHAPDVAKKMGKDAVTFRTTRVYSGSGLTEGRSYGAEAVGFTFDFAMASVGDASTRNIIQALDPNVKKAWLLNDEGKPASAKERKHFDAGNWLKSVGNASWRIFSKNQGEDWAAAIPYAFQMKWQRKVLSNAFSKRWEGHELVFDKGWNGGAYRMDQAGKIVGDYQLAGAIDLHARFVGYNVYTLMFREAHDAVSNSFKHWKDDGYQIKLPEHFNPVAAVVDTARYVVKSTIKGNMYMNPAVIPFWLFRVPQSKWKSQYVTPEAVHAKDAALVGEWQYDPKKPYNPHDWSNYEHYPTKTLGDKFEKGFSQFLNPFGWVSHKVGTGASTMAEKLVLKSGLSKTGRIGSIIADEKGNLKRGASILAHEYTDAAFSYTPYMWAKAETGLLVDDSKGDGKPGQMDKAIYRFMDNVGSFNLRGVGHSIKEMWTLGTNLEQEIVVREGEGVKRIDKNAPPEPVVPAPKPGTVVQVETMARAPEGLTANDHDDQGHDKNWVQSVTGSGYDAARVHSTSTTRH